MVHEYAYKTYEYISKLDNSYMIILVLVRLTCNNVLIVRIPYIYRRSSNEFAYFVGRFCERGTRTRTFADATVARLTLPKCRNILSSSSVCYFAVTVIFAGIIARSLQGQFLQLLASRRGFCFFFSLSLFTFGNSSCWF